MNAKQLFEADGPEGRPPGPGRPLKLSGRMRTVPFRPPGSEESPEDMPEMPDAPGEDVARMVGRGPGGPPRGQFNPKELSQLKDIVILILANLAHSDLDMQIGQALAEGRELDPGQLQHIIDEARNAPIPESHGPLLQKIFQKLGQG